MAGNRPEWMRDVLDGGVRNGCLNCPSRPNMLPLDAMLGVGFGQCFVSRDGEGIWWEDMESEEDPPRLQQFEDQALTDTELHDWQVVFDAPLWSGTWQRQGAGEWLLIERGEGFA